MKSYETAFVPVAQMGGALSNAFFRRKYLFSVEEEYQTEDQRSLEIERTGERRGI